MNAPHKILGAGFVFALLACATAAADAEWKTDFDRATVDLSEIVSGGPPKDGIPAIDRPRFIGHAEAGWLGDSEPVIVLRSGKKARAYPLQILIFHEIVNDNFAGRPLAVTFCPLCNASIVFDRRVDGALLDFGTTGKLRRSDLVMYDRQSESWWQQFTGGAIVGRYAGAQLRRVPSDIVSYADFRAAYPEGEVLSRDTGFTRPYGRNPYRGYDTTDGQPFLLDQPADPRLPPVARVLSVHSAGQKTLYPFSVLREKKVINDTVGAEKIVALGKFGTLSALDASEIAASRKILSAGAFSRVVDGRELFFVLRGGKIVDRATQSAWNILGQATAGPLKGKSLAPVDSGVHFAFAWLAFYPESKIYR